MCIYLLIILAFPYNFPHEILIWALKVKPQTWNDFEHFVAMVTYCFDYDTVRPNLENITLFPNKGQNKSSLCSQIYFLQTSNRSLIETLKCKIFTYSFLYKYKFKWMQ